MGKVKKIKIKIVNLRCSTFDNCQSPLNHIFSKKIDHCYPPPHPPHLLKKVCHSFCEIN